MPIWLIVLLSILGVLYFGFNVWYTWQWFQGVLSGPSLPHRPSPLYIPFLLFFALPAIGAIIAFSFVLPYLNRQSPLQRLAARVFRRPRGNS